MAPRPAAGAPGDDQLRDLPVPSVCAGVRPDPASCRLGIKGSPWMDVAKLGDLHRAGRALVAADRAAAAGAEGSVPVCRPRSDLDGGRTLEPGTPCCPGRARLPPSHSPESRQGGLAPAHLGTGLNNFPTCSQGKLASSGRGPARYSGGDGPVRGLALAGPPFA